MWGQDLNRALPNTYGIESRFILILSSDSYVGKYWTGVEFAAALQRVESGRVLVVQLGTLPPDMPSGLVFIDATHANLVSMIDKLKQKLDSSDP